VRVGVTEGWVLGRRLGRTLGLKLGERVGSEVGWLDGRPLGSWQGGDQTEV
jgi:hypothetical protein